MTDNKEHLAWIYDRMVEVHGENPDVDYMRRLKDIVQGYNVNGELHKDLTETVARVILGKDRQFLMDKNTDDWIDIYNGPAWTDKPPAAIVVFNKFHAEVDQVVSHIFHAINKHIV